METEEDPEIKALKEMSAALRSVPLEARRRMLMWAMERQAADERMTIQSEMGQPAPGRRT